MDVILSIDQGTTGSRAVLYDARGRAVASHHQEFRQRFPKPGWVEHDPREIWESVRSCIERVLAAAPRARVAAIGITNQRETTVLWDRRTGKPIHNAIVWQCRRTSERCEALARTRGIPQRIARTTGLTIDPYFSATKIEWLLKHVPRAREKGRRGDLCFGTTDSWVLWKLTGGKVHATDPTNASRTMLYDIERLRWDASLCELFGVPTSILPEVQPSAGSFGETIQIGRLPAGIPIAGIAGDQQAALAGQACFARGTIKNTYGTGCFLLLNAGATRPPATPGILTTLACGPHGEPVYALEGSVFVAGAAIQWLRDGLGLLARASESERMAREVADTHGVYFVPALTGLGAPYWDPHARGAIVGLTRGADRRHLVRAALEAMAYQTRDLIDHMRTHVRLPLRELRVDGGASANDFLCQFQADMLGIDVVRPAVIESTSLGAAFLAGLAVGFWRDAAEIARLWQENRRFAPRMPRKEAMRLHAGWQDAVQRALSRG